MANKCCLVHTAGEIWMNFVTATVFFIKNIPHICINHWMFVNWPMLHGMYAFRFAYEACVCWRQLISISGHNLTCNNFYRRLLKQKMMIVDSKRLSSSVIREQAGQTEKDNLGHQLTSQNKQISKGLTWYGDDHFWCTLVQISEKTYTYLYLYLYQYLYLYHPTKIQESTWNFKLEVSSHRHSRSK